MFRQIKSFEIQNTVATHTHTHTHIHTQAHTHPNLCNKINRYTTDIDRQI